MPSREKRLVYLWCFEACRKLKSLENRGVRPLRCQRECREFESHRDGIGGESRGEWGLRQLGRWMEDQLFVESTGFDPATNAAGHTGLNHLRWAFMPYLASSWLAGQKVWCIFGARTEA